MQNRSMLLEKIGREFIGLPKGASIKNPDLAIKLGYISKSIREKINAPNSEVVITRKVVKHITEQRGGDALYILKAIPDILVSPSKIAKKTFKKLVDISGRSDVPSSG